MTLRILIADDHEIFRRGLRELLLSHLPSLQLVEVATTSETLSALGREPFDLAIVDISMPGRGGLEILDEVKRQRIRTPILILSAFPEEHWAVRCFSLGAYGYVAKQDAADQLLVAVKRITAGGRYITASVADRLAAQLTDVPSLAPHEVLSLRELQVLQLIAVGESLREIAEHLALSEKTIATYRQRITEKTGLRSAVDIARYALKNGLVH